MILLGEHHLHSCHAEILPLHLRQINQTPWFVIILLPRPERASTKPQKVIPTSILPRGTRSRNCDEPEERRNGKDISDTSLFPLRCISQDFHARNVSENCKLYEKKMHLNSVPFFVSSYGEEKLANTERCKVRKNDEEVDC